MFSKLRNRFLLLLMTTVTVLTVVFFWLIVGLSYQSVERRNVDMLDRGFESHDMSGLEGIPDRFSPVFSVDIDSEGTITNVHSNFSMDTAFYEILVDSAHKKDGITGNTSYDDMVFKYKTFVLDSGGYRVVFLDISRDVKSMKSMIYSLLWIALPLLLLIYVLSKYFADRAIKPIVQSFERQNQFIADASHELKTPLATIDANASLLLANALPEQSKWLGFIKDETLRLEKLTTNLLYLSREPTAKSAYVRCNLSEITNAVLMPLEAVLYEKQVECVSEIEKEVFVMASEEQLNRLISNLIENAIKYTDNYISVTLKKQARSAVMTISNNGAGILPEDINKIWDRFYRADKARQSKGGFGLGLAMAGSIINELGGTVKVTSKSDELTTFVIIIPQS